MKEFIKSLAAELAPVWMTQQEPLKRDPKRSSRDRIAVRAVGGGA